MVGHESLDAKFCRPHRHQLVDIRVEWVRNAGDGPGYIWFSDGKAIISDFCQNPQNRIKLRAVFPEA
jgi:hypothetical protein